ncbi:MAG: hypothetical protein R3B46_10680 [Phycisphaerales bacterium]
MPNHPTTPDDPSQSPSARPTNPAPIGAVQRGVPGPINQSGSNDGLKQVRRELQHARDAARRTLILHRVFEIIAVVLVAGLLLALADYFLRLPRPVRIFNWLAGAALIGGAWWKWGRRAWQFNPPLTDVANRIERARPEIRGLLASAVDFDEAKHSGDSPMTRALEAQVVSRASGSWRREFSSQIVNPRQMRKAGVWMLGALALALVALPFSPKLWSIGAGRVAFPFADTSWPKRTEIIDLTAATVHPTGEALPMQASLARSAWSPSSTQVAVRYRLITDGSRTSERRELLTWQRTRAGDDQSEGELFERLIEPMADEIEYRFETIDDTTEWRRIALVERPTVIAATATITPPKYASAISGTDASPGGEIELGPGTDERAVAPPSLIGSRVRMRIDLNKPVEPGEGLAATLAEIGATIERSGNQWSIDWTLNQPARLVMSLVDEHGISSADEAVFRFDASEDRPASATVTEPASDRAVLATAQIPVVGEGRDDVALTWVSLERQRFTPAGAATGAPSGPGGAMEPTEEPVEVVRVEATNERTLNAQTVLDLSVLGLRPGDELHLSALAMDVLGSSQGAEATRSAPRILRIISETEFVEQVRSMLSEVRQGAIRAVDQQQEARQNTEQRGASRAARRGQSQVSERVSRLEDALQRVDDMVQQNALNDEGLSELLAESQRAVQQAGRASSQAQQTLDQAGARAEEQGAEGEQGEADESELDESEQRQVEEAQERVETELERLVSMLDRGEDSWLVRNSLERMAREQQSLREQAEAAAMSTAGKSLEELDQRERSELERIVEKQEELARKLEELIENIRSREQEMREIDPASAQGMSQAADRAEREQVAQQMQQAAQQASQNQMTNATQRQQQAQDALEEMLEDLDRGEQARQEVLRRTLQSVMDSIKGLIQSQEDNLAALAAAAARTSFTDLDRGMIELNRNTLGVVDLARAEGETLAVVVNHLNNAGEAQEQAIGFLRAAAVDVEETAAAENRSLERLNEALKEAERLAEQMDNAEQERKKRELQKSYREALELQVGVRGDTAPLAALDEIGRRERVMVRRLAEPQQAVRARMDEIVAQIAELADAKVFQFAHDRAVKYMERSSADLEEAEAKSSLAAQDRAISALQAIIESLKDDQPDSDFANQEQQGGGGSGGSQGQQPLIPPTKELKLLRALQSEALSMTMEAGDDGTTDTLKDAASFQRELADIGTDLLGRMQQAGPAQPVPISGDETDSPEDTSGDDGAPSDEPTESDDGSESGSGS